MFTLGLCQIADYMDRDEAMESAARYVNKAVDAGASVVSLPELWNTPMMVKHYHDNAEDESGPSCEFMSDLARQNEIYLIGGSIPEVASAKKGTIKKYYNTSYIYDPNGKRIGKHRKAHLFDIDIKDGITYKESDTFSAGDDITIVQTELGPIGVAVCFDIRFPEMFKKAADAGCKLIVLPAAFNMTTGPAHWELMIRARALDNQLYFATCSKARTVGMNEYVIWGHSTVANPYGAISAKRDQSEGLVLCDIDYDYVNQVRNEIPIGRSDL
ncbi:MAG: carbon-nitrogen hydrolase family protein [Clostridiales Family XIII bacterium]|jgi:predicted amidohydrolase|nr:carbon-nitrogen hydrolase family protein [Clostridiales Family XIII bacterium]